MASLPSPASLQYQMEHIHDSEVPSMVAANVASMVLAVIAVALRFLSRRVAKVKYEWDDWLAVAGLCFFIVYQAIDFVIIHYGAGKHSVNITNPKAFAAWTVVAECVYQPAVVCIKASILYLYYRVFFVSRNFTLVLWAVGTFVFCYSFTSIFLAIFQCVPIASLWDPTIANPRYINIGLAGTITAALNVVTDFALLVLPMPLLYKLQMPGTQKLQIMCTFLLGGFVLVASILRCVEVHTIGDSQDLSWDENADCIWTEIELGVGLISACLPTMRPLFRLSRLGSLVSGRSSKQTSGHSGEKTPGHGGGNTDSENHSNRSLHLHQQNSNPSQSRKFAHLGVLGNDPERGNVHPNSEIP